MVLQILRQFALIHLPIVLANKPIQRKNEFFGKIVALIVDFRFLQKLQPIECHKIHSLGNIETVGKTSMEGLWESYYELSGFLVGFENRDL